LIKADILSIIRDISSGILYNGKCISNCHLPASIGVLYFKYWHTLYWQAWQACSRCFSGHNLLDSTDSLPTGHQFPACPQEMLHDADP